ncbi:MAG TPA: PilZ domain-containing protein [Candidatus Limnocylindrales bacterium]|nr:PilZ domain-containing protein [Candidatus Limnocylindrales bacterium]
MESTTQAVQARGYTSGGRRQIRYPLRTTVVYRWLDNTGLRRHARGWTRDISEAGAYVLSSHCPQKGEFVELSFRLLALRERETPKNGAHLEMGGEVVRVDNAEIAGAAVGFAVRSKAATRGKPTDELSARSWRAGLALGAVCN